MGGWMDGWVGGWMDGGKSQVKDCLQQSNIILKRDNNFFFINIKPSRLAEPVWCSDLEVT